MNLSWLTNRYPKGTRLYLDIETVPDDGRKELWGMPEPIKPPPPNEFIQGTVSDIAGFIKANALSLPGYWLRTIRQAEASGKNRSGIMNALDAADKAEANLIKELSTDPERCRIVAYGAAIDNSAPYAICADHDTEKTLLAAIWDSLAQYPIIIGYNILGFDLPVICARSILLGLTPSTQIDWRKYGNPQVIDLMLARFPRGKAKSLKCLAKQYGIRAPHPNVEGAMVHTMTPDQIGKYVKSDVFVTRELHKKFAGYFCPDIIEDKEGE